MNHFLHAWWIWRCNFRKSSRRYWGGWISWRTAWQATAHLREDGR
jgi:hypothetical protein